MITAAFVLSVVDLGSHPYWYLGRAGGLVAYTLLFLSMVLGLAVSSRIFEGLLTRSWFFEFHKFLSLLVLGAAAFHAWIMLPDPFAQFSPLDLLIPFWSDFKPIPMALGIFSFYGAVLVSASFYLTKVIGQPAWRQLHYASFAVYLAGAVHAVGAGTDSGLIEARLYYVVTSMSLVFFICYRILMVRGTKAGNKRTELRSVNASDAGARSVKTATG